MVFKQYCTGWGGRKGTRLCCAAFACVVASSKSIPLGARMTQVVRLGGYRPLAWNRRENVRSEGLSFRRPRIQRRPQRSGTLS